MLILFDKNCAMGPNNNYLTILGVIFDGDPIIEDIFNISVKMVNRNRNSDHFLPAEKIIAEKRFVAADDVYDTSEKGLIFNKKSYYEEEISTRLFITIIYNNYLIQISF